MITHPDDLSASITEIDRLLAGEIARVDLEKRYVRSDGALRWGQLTIALARDRDGRPTHRVAQVVDITQRREDEARLRAHARVQEALRSLATLVASEADPRAIHGAAAQSVVEVLEADVGAVARLEPGHGRLVACWARAGGASPAVGTTVDLQAPTALAQTLRTGQLARFAGHDRPVSEPGVGARCGLAAPIIVNGALWGAIGVGWNERVAADQRERETLSRITDLVSLAVAGAEARQRRARDAHTRRLESLGSSPEASLTISTTSSPSSSATPASPAKLCPPAPRSAPISKRSSRPASVRAR